jgi:adenylyl cyclase-associated protein
MASPLRPSNQPLVPSLTELLCRLEAATSRLEDIATSVATFDDHTGSPGSGAQRAIAAPPSGPLAIAAAPSPPPKPVEVLPPEVKDFDKMMSEDLAPFVKLSDALDPLIGQQASLTLIGETH